MSPRIPESALRAPVSAYLEARGFRVWVDPEGRDFLDLVAARGDEVGLVELKVSDWRTVRAQAVVRRALADWVSVALPTDRLASRLIDSLRGPVAPRIGVYVVDGRDVRERRAPIPLDPPGAGSPAEEARTRFRELVRRALHGEIPEGIAWGAAARRTGRGRGYRLDEFGP